MVSSASRRIKLSVNLRPFVSRVVRDGKAQRNFTATYGHRVGGCVRAAVHKGMTGAAIKQAVRDCAKGRGKSA